MSKLKILHIASDYPDHTGNNYTNAVKNLLNETRGDIIHKIIAFRRIKFGKVSFERCDDYFYFQIPSFPFALFHIMSSFFYTLVLLKEIKKNNIQFDIIHGHKLTIDGVLAFFLAKLTGTKYVLSVRADTDLKFINNKPFSRFIYRYIFKKARHIFWVSAWAKDTMNKKLSFIHPSESNLPNIVTSEGGSNLLVNEKVAIATKFIFVGRLESAEKKGLLDIIEIMNYFPNAKLEIFGVTNNRINDELLAFANNFGVHEQIVIKGNVPKVDLINNYRNYCALLMPSRNETFGMVYVEALLEGLPVLCCEKSGIDGYLNEKNYLQKVKFKDKLAIKKAMHTLLNEQSVIKEHLRNDLNEGLLDVFLVDNVKNQYLRDLMNV